MDKLAEAFKVSVNVKSNASGTLLQAWTRWFQFAVGNKYELAIQNVENRVATNRGEKDEIIAQMKILCLNDQKSWSRLINIFGDEASDGVRIVQCGTREVIAHTNDISKSASKYKADCILEMIKTGRQYRTTIKSKNGAPYAILNHTPRTAKVFRTAGRLSHTVPSLDKIAEEYVTKRTAGGREDMKVNELSSLNDANHKEALMEVIAYFMFDGTGESDSKCPAEAVAIYEGTHITFIKISSLDDRKNYIASIWDRVILSFRNKQMPPDITNCHPWVYIDKGKNGSIKHKGSLHLRVK